MHRPIQVQVAINDVGAKIKNQKLQVKAQAIAWATALGLLKLDIVSWSDAMDFLVTALAGVANGDPDSTIDITSNLGLCLYTPGNQTSPTSSLRASACHSVVVNIEPDHHSGGLPGSWKFSQVVSTLCLQFL